MPALLLLLIPLGLVGLLAAAKAKANGRAEDQLDGAKPDGGPMPAPTTGNRARLRCAVAAAGVDDAWLRFMEQTAHRESRFSPRAANTSTGEAAAARRGAGRWRELIATAGYPHAAWEFGSGGWYGFLPSSAFIDGRTASFRYPLAFVREVGPNGVHQMGVSVASALAYAKGLTRWPNFKGSWASLNVGWGNPGRMGNPEAIAESARKLEDRAAQLGWPRGWAMDPVTPLPSRSPAELVTLARAAQRAAEACG